MISLKGDDITDEKHKTDLAKQASPRDDVDVLLPMNFSFFMEWYLSDTFAVGVKHSVDLLAFDSTYNNITLTETLAINKTYLTATWLLYEVNESGRIGFTCGAGPSSYYYSIEEKEKNGTTSTKTGKYDDTVSGMAYTAGAFYDFGSGPWGARFGLNLVDTQYSSDVTIPVETSSSINSLTVKEHKLTPDGSGVLFDVKIRYNF